MPISDELRALQQRRRHLDAAMRSEDRDAARARRRAEVLTAAAEKWMDLPMPEFLRRVDAAIAAYDRRFPDGR